MNALLRRRLADQEVPALELARREEGGRDDLLRVVHALDDEMERFVRYDDLFSLEVALIKAGNVLAQNTPRSPQAVTDGVAVTDEPVEARAEPPAPRARPPLPEEPGSEPM